MIHVYYKAILISFVEMYFVSDKMPYNNFIATVIGKNLRQPYSSPPLAF